MYSTNEQGEIVLTMNQEDFNSLVLLLGYAAGSAWKEADKERGYAMVRLTNRLLDGDPHFIPYDVPAAPEVKQ